MGKIVEELVQEPSSLPANKIKNQFECDGHVDDVAQSK